MNKPTNHPHDDLVLVKGPEGMGSISFGGTEYFKNPDETFLIPREAMRQINGAAWNSNPHNPERNLQTKVVLEEVDNQPPT